MTTVPKWTTFAAALAFVASSAVAQQAAPAGDAVAQPKIKFDKKTIDLGEVVKGEKAKFTFEFRNEGTSDLEIKQAKPSCGCTVADFTRVVKAGETGTVTASIDTKRFKGPITKTVTVTSNDPVNGTVHLQAKATVKALIDVSPSEHVYFRVFRGDDQPTKRVLKITSDDDNPFEITKVSSTNPAIETNLVDLKKTGEADGTGGAYRLEVDVKDDAPIGPLTGVVTLATTHSKVPSMTLNINGQVLGEVIVTPQKVYLGQVTSATASSIKRTVRIERRRGGDFKIEKVESTNPAIEAQVSPVEDGKIYTLTISVSSELSAGPINANVVVQTNDDEQRSIEIPVIGTVKG